MTWLIRDYVDHLLSGGEPVAVEVPAASELARAAQEGGAFDWLSREPDVYSDKDGEPV